MSPSHGCDQHVQCFLINIQEIISVYFLCGGGFLGKEYSYYRFRTRQYFKYQDAEK